MFSGTRKMVDLIWNQEEKQKQMFFFKPACGVLLSKGKKDLHCPTPASGLCIPNLFKNQGFLKMIQENSNYKAGIDHLFSCVYVV